MATALVFTALLVATLANDSPDHLKDKSTFFGVAKSSSRGEICLQLRSEEPGKPVAESYRCYKPTDEHYLAIRKQVGEIQVGQDKVIEPVE